MSVLEGDEGGAQAQTELRGHRPTAPTTVCRPAPPKPWLWNYEKKALVPQPESGLALFSSLEGVRTWLGGTGLPVFVCLPTPVWASWKLD